MQHPDQTRPAHGGKQLKSKTRWSVPLSIVIVGMLGPLASCQKEPSAPLDSPGTGHPVSIKTLVETFLDRAQNRLEKAQSHMSADSAEWYLEAGLNYSLAKAWLEYGDSRVDTVRTILPVENGSVALAEVYRAFNDLHNSLAGIEQDGVQHLVLADVSTQVGPTGLNLVVRYVVGSGYTKGSPNINFPPGYALLWWQPGSSNCGCGTFTSSQCADKTIQQRVNAAIMIPMQPGDFLTDIETWTVSYLVETSIPGKTYDANYFIDVQGVPGHENMDFPIYVCSLPGGDCSSCLDDSDLSFHTQGVYDVLTWINDTHVPTKRPITSLVVGDLGSSSNGSTYLHSCNFTYGRKQSGSTG